jgi:hypothetical protein
MNWSYLFKHWLGTLLFGPIIAQIIEIFLNQNNKILDFFEYYILFLLFGFLFSLPTYILYGILYWILANKKIDYNHSKFILIIFANAGIIITFFLINGFSTYQGILSYCLASIITGLFLKLNFKNDHNKPYN